MRWFASLRSAKKYCASVSNTAGGYGIRPYVFCFRPPGENSTFFIIYYFLFFICLSAHLLLIALTKALMPATIISVWVPQPQVSSPEAHFRPT